MDRLNDMLGGLKFADKAETKKSIKALERQLKNLYDLVKSGRGKSVGQDEDAMFNRKHICGYACASCEKDLTNLYGKKVQYMPWG